MSLIILVPTSIGTDDIKCPCCGAGYQFDVDCDFWGADETIHKHECRICGTEFKYKVVIVPEQHKAELVK